MKVDDTKVRPRDTIEGHLQFSEENAGMLRDKTEDDYLMYIPMMMNKINPYVEQKYWFKSLCIASLKHPIYKSIKVSKPTNLKDCL